MIIDRGNESYIECKWKPLGRCSIFYYGVGHMLNDITSACWFTYLLVYLTDIGLTPSDAAVVMLSGQIADGFATIFVGEMIDRFGHFKMWHGGGSILVAISFSSVFGGCIPCKILGRNSATLRTVGYSIFAAIFNIGWAATQVSHMAMVNCITLNSSSRVVLASCRNAFTMVANLCLYAIALLVFSAYSGRISMDIESQYRWIAYFSIFIGCCFVAIFLFGTKEPRWTCQSHSSRSRILWSHWFKKMLYYQVALVYVLTRLITNISQALLAFYVINDLRMAQSTKALVPAVIYISSFLVSIMLQEIRWNSLRLKGFFTSGAILWIFSGTGIFLLPHSLHNVMYLLSITIGVGNALMTVTGISMESVLVGNNLSGCAFVYGSLSFLDKISCGLALYILESYQKSTPNLKHCNAIGGCPSLIRYALGLVPTFCSLLGVAVTYTMNLDTAVSKPSMEPLLS